MWMLKTGRFQTVKGIYYNLVDAMSAADNVAKELDIQIEVWEVATGKTVYVAYPIGGCCG